MNIVQTSAPPLPADLSQNSENVVGGQITPSRMPPIIALTYEERDCPRPLALVLRAARGGVAAICKLDERAPKSRFVQRAGEYGPGRRPKPHHGEVVVSRRRLDKIRDVETASNTMNERAA